MLPMSRQGRSTLLTLTTEVILILLTCGLAVDIEASCALSSEEKCLQPGVKDETSLLQTQAAVNAHRNTYSEAHGEAPSLWETVASGDEESEAANGASGSMSGQARILDKAIAQVDEMLGGADQEEDKTRSCSCKCCECSPCDKKVKKVSWQQVDSAPKPTPCPPPVVYMPVPSPAKQTTTPAPKVVWKKAEVVKPPSLTTPPPSQFGPCSTVDTDCFPKCHWNCSSTKECEQECKPMCKPPVCTSRCDGMNVSLCHMECQKPHCAVVCPKKVCRTSVCTTVCSDPVCRMKCDSAKMPCHSACKKPECVWACKAPKKCPKPKCKLDCYMPPPCLNSTTPNATHQTESSPAPAPAKLLQMKPGEVATMRVPITRMRDDMTLERTHVELPVKHITTDPEDSKNSREYYEPPETAI